MLTILGLEKGRKEEKNEGRKELQPGIHFGYRKKHFLCQNLSFGD